LEKLTRRRIEYLKRSKTPKAAFESANQKMTTPRRKFFASQRPSFQTFGVVSNDALQNNGSRSSSPATSLLENIPLLLYNVFILGRNPGSLNSKGGSNSLSPQPSEGTG